MRRILAPRASTLLYNTLLANKEEFGKGNFLLPANVCPIVPVTFLKAGIGFEFLDIDVKSQCLTKDQILSRVTNVSMSVGGLLFVHSYGNMQNTLDLFSELKTINPSLFIIDDRCIGIPEIKSDGIDTHADLTLYSTGYAKFVEFGYGGFGYIADNTKYENSRGEFFKQDHELLVGQMNTSIRERSLFRYQDSAWLIRQHNLEDDEYLKRIEDQIPKSTAQKEKLNAIYKENLPISIQMGAELTRWRFNIQVENKELLLEKIFEAGLFASSHYASVSELFGGNPASNADFVHSRMLNLFNDYRFTEDMAYLVCEIINENIK